MATLSPQRLNTTARRQASWVVSAGHQFIENRCPSLAASIAFYSAFSLAPTLVMVLAVAGWFFGGDKARSQLFSEVHGVLGTDAAAGITTIVENAHRAGTGGIAAVISIAMLVIGASATFSSLNTALNIVWPPTGPRTSSVLALVRVRLVSFGLVLGVAFLLIVSLVLDTAITIVGQWLLGNSPYLFVGNLAQLAVGLAVMAFAFAGLLKFLPDAQVRWRDALVGGIVAAVLFSVGKKLFALYLAHAGFASTFGAAGSLAVLLMWLYFSTAVLLLGAEFAAARGRMHDPRDAWGFGHPVPPGSRAKLASVLAASTHAPNGDESHATYGARNAPVRRSKAASIADGAAVRGALHASAATPGSATTPRSVRLGRAIVRYEDRATHAAAATLVQAGRAAEATDRYVKRHPWESALLAAGAALTATAFASRHHRAGKSDSDSARVDDPAA
ncbi:MAG TPA: YihY/virulence factor BrkB family protein [Paraburkholderia sp.]